jgi:GT2 family glycosyltransferase
VDIVSFASGDDSNIASWEMRQKPYEHPKFYDPVTLQTGWSSHACILMRRELFNQVGGYEEKIFMYGEDVELSFRFRSFGFDLRYFPSSVVYHHTYEEAGEAKPLQFYGSTLSNAYLRLRYGSLINILSIPVMFARLLAADTGFPDSRRKLTRNIGKLLYNTPYFLAKRRFGQCSFPFRHWDYELVRDGAFHEAPGELPDTVPLVSVVTRTYKGRAYLLRECMQSVFHQTWPNVEIVIVEDGGNSAQSVAAEMAEEYPDRIVRYKALPKLGRCLVGNEGLEMTQGKYVMFLDDDDLLFCDHIETCVSELQADEALGGVYALPWDVETRFRSAELEDGYEEMSHSTTDVLRQEFDREVIRHHNYIAIQSIVFRRELYERYGGFDVDLDNLEDWNLWLRYSSEEDFKLVSKTTSMYKTPWDLAEKSRRQLGLDGYYRDARQKNEAFLQQIAARAT